MLSEIAKNVSNALTHIFIRPIINRSKAVKIRSSMVSANDAICTYHACIEIIHILGLFEKTLFLLSSVDLIVEAYETMILRLSIRNCGKTLPIKLKAYNCLFPRSARWARYSQRNQRLWLRITTLNLALIQASVYMKSHCCAHKGRNLGATE